MGMYDEIRIDPVIPLPGLPSDHNREFQTKSTPSQWLDLYEIREDDSLWHEEYDIEDRSDPTATGIMALAGSMARVNEHWVQNTSFTGEIEFHDWDAETKIDYRYSCYFIAGRMVVPPTRLGT